ncbi:MAG: hypothetical protein Q9160_003533 [Pyrenula sp. 1 TL-2023]
MSADTEKPAPASAGEAHPSSNVKPSASHLFHSDAATPRHSIVNLLSRNSKRSKSATPSDRTPFPGLGKEIEVEKDIEKIAESLPSHLPQQPEQPVKDSNLVEWDGPDDPENPMNWGKARKWVLTMSMAFMNMNITFASSVFSTATTVVAKQFDISLEVSTLGTSLFVLGFALGPLIWGPLSELHGRMIPLFTAYSIFIIFQIPVAVATNLETIMICRFFGGVCGSAPLAIIGGCLADFWGPVDRAISVTCFAAAVFIGPAAGPIVGGFITESYLGWRWTAWITMVMATFFGIVALTLARETYAPVILQRRAGRLRRETKNWALHSTRDEAAITFSEIITRYFSRPFEMMVKEPILLFITVYMALVYGIMYLFFEAFPISFQEERGWSLGVGGLPFLSITLGVAIGGIYVAYISKTTFARKMEEHGGRVVPEDRLPPMILGGCLLPAGLFWFAWTSDPDINWVPQVISAVLIGMGIFTIFMSSFNYIIDVYLMLANSAVAGNTFVRSLSGAGFPMFAVQMYDRLGVAWATSLLAFLCLAMVPIPVLFYLYGQKIRALSKFSPKF